MKIQERKLNDITVFDLDGTFVLGGDADFKKHVETALSDGCRNLLINLAKVSYMDSSGLGELISGYTKMRRVNGQMKLLNLSKRLNQLLVITKLITVFEIFDSESEAVSSFKADEKPSAEAASADGNLYSRSGQ
ncbi:MAG: STAS domain-containing protein [Blastocatellia bacterium]